MYLNFKYLFLFLFFAPHYLSAQSVLVKLKPYNCGTKIFYSEVVYPKSIHDQQDYTLPKFELEEFCILVFPFQRFQYWFNEYNNGFLDSSFYNKVYSYYRFDTSELSTKKANPIISVLIGTRENGNKILIPDINNDRSFRNENVFNLDSFLSSKQEIFFNNIELYKNNSLFQKAVQFQLIDVGEKVFCCNDSLELSFDLNNCMKGQIIIGNTPVDFFIHLPVNDEFQFDSTKTEIYFKPSDSPFNKNVLYDVKYKIGDTFFIKKAVYVLKYCSLYGDSLVIEKIGGSSLIYGYNLNYFLNNDTCFDELTKAEVSLSERSPKYKILDFWGSWCGPCEDALPAFQKLYESKKLNHAFEFFSIAYEYSNDSAAAIEKIKKNKMTWKNIIEYQNSSPSLIKNLRITSYPTFIVLGRNNKIIFRGSNKYSVNDLVAFVDNLK